MGKHIIDGSRKGDAGQRLERYTALDHTAAGAPGPQSETLMRNRRKPSEGERLRRFTGIERRDG